MDFTYIATICDYNGIVYTYLFFGGKTMAFGYTRIKTGGVVAICDQDHYVRVLFYFVFAFCCLTNERLYLFFYL